VQTAVQAAAVLLQRTLLVQEFQGKEMLAQVVLVLLLVVVAVVLERLVLLA
jgi:hypothetical protein